MTVTLPGGSRLEKRTEAPDSAGHVGCGSRRPEPHCPALVILFRLGFVTGTARSDYEAVIRCCGGTLGGKSRLERITSDPAICHGQPTVRGLRYTASSPRRLLVVATGNITNAALLALFETHLDVIITALEEADYVELGPNSLVVHRRR
jgi:uncharacterized protein (DUF433 family)